MKLGNDEFTGSRLSHLHAKDAINNKKAIQKAITKSLISVPHIIPQQAASTSV